MKIAAFLFRIMPPGTRSRFLCGRVGVLLLLLTFLAIGSHISQAQSISTVVGGNDSVGPNLGDGGPAIDCGLQFPRKIAFDASGNMYIADEMDNRIRKVNTSGIITTIAGTGIAGYSGDDSAATAAMLNLPYGVAVDVSGNVYIADNYNHRIRKVNTSGIITTYAGTGVFGYNGDSIAATAAELYSPHGVAIDGSGDLLIGDALNNRVRKVNHTTGIITTIAGNGTPSDTGDGGPAISAEVNSPYGIALDVTGDIYIADFDNNSIRKINLAGFISTIAGTRVVGYNGDNIAATSAELKFPAGVAVDAANNVYIAELYGNRVRKVNTSGIITTIAGTGTAGYNGDGEPAIEAKLFYPEGVNIDNSGNIYITDGGNGRIRYIECTLSVNKINASASAINVYPNPSTGDFTVNISSAINEEAQIIIINAIGQIVTNCVAITNKPVNLHLDERPRLYFISAITSQGISTTKLLITP